MATTTGNLTAYWPDPNSIDGNSPLASTIGWKVMTGQSNTIVSVYPYATAGPSTAVGSTIGNVYFRVTNAPDTGDTRSAHYFWSTLANTQTTQYVVENTYASTSSGYFVRIPLPRRTDAYTATVNISFEVAARSGAQFSDGSQLATTSMTVTVPALPSYTISYNANGGSGAPSSQTKTHGSAIAISSTTPTRNGYVFRSWSTSSGGGGTWYSPQSTYDEDADLVLYAVWDPIISFSGNGGSNIPSSIRKPFNGTATIPSNVPTKDGFVFVEWNTNSNGNGTSYQPSGTISASMNTALTLYAIFSKITAPPTISSITAVRCNESGVASDMGTCVKLTSVWKVDTTYDPSNTGTTAGYYRVSGSSSTTGFSFNSGDTGTSGTAIALLWGFDTDTQYEFTVVVNDTNTDEGHVYYTARTVILTRAKFILDLKAGGEAMGLFSAAPSSGLEVGKDAQFDGNMTVLGNLTAPNLALSTESGASVVSASGSFSVSTATAYKYGPIRMVTATFSTSDALTVGTNYTIGTLTSAYSTPKPIGFASQYGVGYVSGTSVYFKPLVNVGASTSMYMAITYIKP